jgi:hypothetical protein
MFTLSNTIWHFVPENNDLDPIVVIFEHVRYAICTFSSDPSNAVLGHWHQEGNTFRLVIPRIFNAEIEIKGDLDSTIVQATLVEAEKQTTYDFKMIRL